MGMVIEGVLAYDTGDGYGDDPWTWSGRREKSMIPRFLTLLHIADDLIARGMYLTSECI